MLISQNDTPLRSAQLTMVEMMKVVHSVCVEHNISYWLSDGSLLGSERHKGFIPWDDDSDIGMLRDDYNKFAKVIADKLPSKFHIETETVHTHGKHNWLKILYLDDFEWEDWNGENRKGISIDIFPFDFVQAPNHKTPLEKGVHRLASILYPENVTGLKDLIRRIIYNSKIHNMYTKVNKPSKYITYGIETPYFGWAYFEVDDIFPLQMGEFENNQFYIPRNPSRYLTTLYGDDYMELPEESKRQSHMTNLSFSKDHQ
ncbi:LicD family protein [Fredinandcohnia sp. 179-A 10B2 NHS]|uniref:LicD family protein n=1 Tax=Fredinandcohnia sp. 179-A 10B2 NHS TaxID=3235176 RepID=UPI0039A076D8